MAAVIRRSVTSLGRIWLSTMFLRCNATSVIAWLPAPEIRPLTTPL